MANDTGNLGSTASTDLTVETLNQVDTATKQLPSPTFVTDTVLPEDLTGERRECVGGVTDEAAHSVRVHAQQEGDEQVVSVPERLERLLPNSVVGSRVHQQHAEKHHVSSNSTGLGVVNLERQHGSNLRPLNIEEATFLLVI